MTTIYVDADACPVKDEAVKVADRHGLRIVFVSNAHMRLPVGRRVERVVVPEGPDQADDWIAEHAQPSDIVVTADIPLAGRCLKAGAQALGPTGRAFDDAAIGMALAMRELNQHLREIGAGGHHNAAFQKSDRSRFLQALETAVRSASRA